MSLGDPPVAPSPKRKGSKTAKSRVSKTKSSKKAKGKGRSHQPDICNFGSAFTSNVFKDTARNADLPDQPTWTATRKADALKELIASVPEERKKTARIEKGFLLKATQNFKGQGSVRSDGRGGWVVKGMVTSLKNHQLLGAAFMRERELAGDLPRGGICGDGMGLGKTVTMLANMANDTTGKNEERKITLIVVPAALVTQWDAEIKKHCKERHLGIVMKYISGHKPLSDDPVRTLQNYDIIITTYHDVMASYPKAEYPIELQTAREKQSWWEKYFDDNKGDLHKLRFHRIVLDEAQAIKNHKSRTSLACRALEATHRWALSGTPVVNSPAELYAYFKFLRVPYTGTFNIFKENYHGDNDPDKVQRLQVMLSKFMIRRTHQDTMFGAAIIKLPKAEEKIFWVDFNEFERAVYEIVRRRMIIRINTMAKSDKLERNYSNVLTMLLRLRQMCANLLLVEVVMRDILELEDHHKIRELADIEHENNAIRTAQISHIRKVLQTTAPDKTVDTAKLTKQSEEEDPNIEPTTSNAPEGEDADNPIVLDHGRQHGLRFDFQKYLKTLREGKKWKELQIRTVCTSCRNPPEDPWVTSCYHLYCWDCLETLQLEWASKGAQAARCMECSLEFTKSKDCAAFDLDSVLNAISDDGDDDGLDALECDVEFPHMNRWKKKSKKKKSDDECVKSWIDMGGTILPSAKTIAIKAQILNWLQRDPDVKIIVYTQFYAMMRILGKMCDSEGWKFLQYHGKMSRGARDNAIVKFGAKGSPILLASLKCGGLGLNLTMASKVICVDPWWNNAVEQQAFCRVFRIGQEQETQMTRFVVRGTVDEDMIKMQNRKQAEIDKIMEDGDDGSRKS
ncbi:hypothetical protein K490DRAFT_52277 [Saccharata proteae CBS 121410]|uniref:P-loop containing nucleoside triphosphate hydrolase protein n=1 Tax=Saccharata proteae CBS 121410 TaxID=1314787 RepID=A0A9P4HPE1_9PEZI|nr:hypothetical protein K490DRAFT_52277 [Saccharata proteae CBS 121410]